MARNAPSVDAYGDGGFRLAGARREGSVLILKDEARSWDVAAADQLSVESLAEVLAAGQGEVELLVLGMGRTNSRPPKALRDALARAGVGLEFMDTPTAAKTYNLLTAEGRRVAAALIAI